MYTSLFEWLGCPKTHERISASTALHRVRLVSKWNYYLDYHMFPLSTVSTSYTDPKLKLKLKYPSNLISHEWFIPLAPVLWGLQLTDVQHRSFLRCSPQIHHLSCRHLPCVRRCAIRAGKGQTDRQTALQLWPCNRKTHWKALAFPAPGSLVTSSVGHSYVTQYVKFWVCSEENKGQLDLLNFFILFDLLKSPDLQQDLGNDAEVSEHPKVHLMVTFLDILLQTQKSSAYDIFPVFELLALLCKNSYNFKSFSKTASNWNKDLLPQKLHVWTYCSETRKYPRFWVQRQLTETKNVPNREHRQVECWTLQLL